MAYKIDKAGQITIDGWEKGIAPSPHSGIANIQNANISTEQGEVMASFGRVQQTQTNNTTTMNLGALSSTTVFSGDGLQAGMWITTIISGISGISNATKYYVLSSSGTTITLSATYNGVGLTGLGLTGACSYTITTNMKTPVSSATETYFYSGSIYHRYYLLAVDSIALTGDVWVNDSRDTIGWRLPTTVGLGATAVLPGTSISVHNGWLFWFNGTRINCKSTSLLDSAWTPFAGLTMTNSNVPHFSISSHSGLQYTDGNYIGRIYPNTGTLLDGINVQSYASYTASGGTGTASVISGAYPIIPNSTLRIPVVFFTAGALPTQISALGAGAVAYILSDPSGNGNQFSVYAAATGGSPLTDLVTGAVGTQYYNTFYPLSSGVGFGTSIIDISPQRLNMSSNEIAQYMSEVGQNIIIGCASNSLYSWNQIDEKPSDLVPLSESNVQDMITVNNVAYIFAGNKGNIYVTNGGNASAVISVPDYCAGIAGTPSTYIEPYFSWGDAMYLRGRIYFSIQDQRSGKAGNCGGIWSFVPVQSQFINQDIGASLRLENQSSYGSYNGVSTILIPSQEQNAVAPQYWNGWRNSYSDGSSTLFGIDGTSTHPVGTTIIETDLIPTGTALDKKTFSQIEYKLSSPLVAGETVAISYRQNSTDAWTSCGTAIEESTTPLSGYFPVNFEKGQWLQLQITLTPLATTASSFCRLKEIIIR
jgi:hypothetical protein